MNRDLSSERIGWGTSIAFHVLLALLFFLYLIELKPFELEFTLVSFSPATEIESGAPPTLSSVSSEAPLIELPKRAMLDDASPLLKLPESTRQAVMAPEPVEKLDLTQRENVFPRERLTIDQNALSMRERADIKPIPLGEEILEGKPDDQLGSKISGDEMFNIAWDGPTRTKLSGKLPEYPPGVDKAVTVRISFEVTPDGIVSQMSPVTKGQPLLEKVSMDALRNWRFNRLDQSMPKLNQNGVVTFVFELR